MYHNMHQQSVTFKSLLIIQLNQRDREACPFYRARVYINFGLFWTIQIVIIKMSIIGRCLKGEV